MSGAEDEEALVAADSSQSHLAAFEAKMDEDGRGNRELDLNLMAVEDEEIRRRTARALARRDDEDDDFRRLLASAGDDSLSHWRAEQEARLRTMLEDVEREAAETFDHGQDGLAAADADLEMLLLEGAERACEEGGQGGWTMLTALGEVEVPGDASETAAPAACGRDDDAAADALRDAAAAVAAQMAEEAEAEEEWEAQLRARREEAERQERRGLQAELEERDAARKARAPPCSSLAQLLRPHPRSYPTCPPHAGAPTHRPATRISAARSDAVASARRG